MHAGVAAGALMISYGFVGAQAARGAVNRAEGSNFFFFQNLQGIRPGLVCCELELKIIFIVEGKGEIIPNGGHCGKNGSNLFKVNYMGPLE